MMFDLIFININGTLFDLFKVGHNILITDSGGGMTYPC